MSLVAKLERNTVVGKAEEDPVQVTLDDLINYAERDLWEFIDFLNDVHDSGLNAEHVDLTFD